MSSVWLQPPTGRPRRSPQISRDRIVAEAVALLDADGAEGLTMRRLAARLDVTATALYWHVRTREDVLDLAFDQIFGDVPLPSPTADWRADVRRLILAWRAAMLRHPWAPALIGRPQLGPNVLARTEFLQDALTRGGRSGRALAVTTHLLANYVIGAALTESTWRRTADPSAREEARRHVAAHPADYPTLIEAGHLDDGRWPDDDLFTAGLDVILTDPLYAAG